MTSSESGAGDVQAIAEFHAVFERQKRAFAADRCPSLEVRQTRVGRIVPMMLQFRERISAALAEDFGSHPAGAADLIETLGVVGRAQYVLQNLEAWMAPEERGVEPGLFGTARAAIRRQPKGVIGNMAPWNFPFDIGVGPVIEMLAAGNRVILKPSEHTPACGALLREMIAATFEPELVTVVTGGLDLARSFAEAPFDHLLYTGGIAAGRQVMAAAAKNLTPITLELGGKCPVIVLPGAVEAETVKTIVGTKMIKNGQMCVAPDYALVPRAELDRFSDLAQGFVEAAAPDYALGSDCTGIISARHLKRLEDMLDEARARQSRIVTLGTEVAPDPESRRMPLRLVLDPAPDLRLMQEEIFGPILPVMPYDSIDQAIEFVNRGERPLGLYVMGDDQTAVEHVLSSTHSGGAAVNACALQGALPSLGFGGVGASGMGRHHGIEGFREFSNPRGVVVRGEGDQVDAFFAPYAKAEAIVQHVLTGGAG